MIKTPSALKKEFVNNSYLAIHKAPILILSDIDDSISWGLIRHKEKSFPPREAAENKMQDRSGAKGIIGNANCSQIIPVSSGDQVQIQELFLQCKIRAEFPLQYQNPACFSCKN